MFEDTSNFLLQKPFVSCKFWFGIFSYVVWIGDLNFRLDEGLSATDIELLVQKKDLETLLKKDQLSIVRNNHRAFTELVEDKITFPPTYKYEFGTQEFDLK